MRAEKSLEGRYTALKSEHLKDLIQILLVTHQDRLPSLLLISITVLAT